MQFWISEDANPIKMFYKSQKCLWIAPNLLRSKKSTSSIQAGSDLNKPFWSKWLVYFIGPTSYSQTRCLYKFFYFVNYNPFFYVQEGFAWMTMPNCLDLLTFVFFVLLNCSIPRLLCSLVSKVHIQLYIHPLTYSYTTIQHTSLRKLRQIFLQAM